MEGNSSGNSTKHQKVGEERYVAGYRIDLEDLPESILLHILSFLPTKDVLRASVLSKRWKYLWKSVNSFRFKEDLFCSRSHSYLFRDTVERVLSLRDSVNICLFSLSCGVDYIYDYAEDGGAQIDGDGGDNDDDMNKNDIGDDSGGDDGDNENNNNYENEDGDGEDGNTGDVNDGGDGHDDNDDETRVNNWISVALNHKVQVLKLQLSVILPFPFHSSLFTCESLTELEIDMFDSLILPSRICFPRLKILTIKNVTFVDDQSTSQLFSGCIVLEKLVLNECMWDDVNTVCISSPTLQTLLIYESGDQDKSNCQVMIFGEAIKTFDYVGELKNDYCLSGLTSLVDSVINMGNIRLIENEGRQTEVAYRAHKLLKGLSSVRELYLCCDTVKVLNYTDEFFTHIPVYHNLTFLRVNFGAVDFACGALQNLLQKCPSLNTLKFVKGITLNTSDDEYELDPVPSCFLTGLKTVYIGDFMRTEPERHVAFLVLENARVLERLCITLGGFNKNEKEDLIHITSIPIRSNCEMCLHI